MSYRPETPVPGGTKTRNVARGLTGGKFFAGHKFVLVLLLVLEPTGRGINHGVHGVG